MKRYEQNYESIDGLLRTAKASMKLAGAGEEPTVGFGERCREEFVGRKFEAEQDLYTAVASPWDEGLALFEKLRNNIADIVRPRRPRRRRKFREDEGDGVCPDRLNMGQAYWEGFGKPPRQAAPMITVACDMATSAGMRSESICWRGVSAFVISDMLEDAGYRVRLVAYSATDNALKGGGQNLLTYTIKDHNSPLNTSSLINSVSGWFYRTICFAAYFQQKAKGWPKPNTSLGRPRPLTSDEIDDLDLDVDLSGIWNEDDARKAVEDTVSRFC